MRLDNTQENIEIKSKEKTASFVENIKSKGESIAVVGRSFSYHHYKAS